MQEAEVTESSVGPDQEKELTATFKAPYETGNYISYFKLCIGEATFGPKFWCKIDVHPEPEEEVKQPVIVP
jgi:hypothetical protein